jgi:hypothetical protein
MKRQNTPRPWALATLLLAPVAPLLAEDAPTLRVKLEEPEKADKNRFGLSYRMSFNVTAQFKNVGNVGKGPSGGIGGPGPATGRGVDRTYDDGYNRVDISGNNGGLTWFWAYKNESQIVDDTVVMHSSSAQSVNSKTTDDDPQHGFELTYNRELGRCEKTGWLWGLEGAFGWTDIDIRDRRPLVGGVHQIADAYALGGIDPTHNMIPPGGNAPAPYTDGEGRIFHPGTYEGPGSLIDDLPNRTMSSSRSGSVITGTRRFDADLFTYRLGPYVDMPIDDKWTFSFSAGAAVGVVNGDFSVRQNVSTGGTSKFQSASGSNTDVVFGGYLSALIRYAIDEHWGVFVGGQYLGLTDYEAKAGGQKIEIDFARTANATMGVSFSF